jgi:hypothetical protein
MKKQHFLNHHYQKLTLHQKINVKDYFINNYASYFGLVDFEFLCLVEP